MSIFRQTQMTAGPSVIGTIGSIVNAAFDSTDREETRLREKKHREEKQRRDAERRRRVEAERRERHAREQAHRRMEEERRSKEALEAARGRVRAVSDLIGGSVDQTVTRFAADDLERAGTEMEQAQLALGRSDSAVASRLAGRALESFDAASRNAARRRREFMVRRDRATSARDDAQARMTAMIGTDEIVKKWRGDELNGLFARLGEVDRAIETEDFEAAESKSAAIISELEEMKAEARALETKSRMREAVVARLSGALCEMGFDVVSDTAEPDDPASHVMVIAGRDSGEEFSAVIDFDCVANYEFDGYEGESCVKDADQLGAILAEKYDVTQRGGERISTHDPDRIGKTARSLPISGRAAGR